MDSLPIPDIENDWLAILFFLLVFLLPYFLGEKAAKIPVLGRIAKRFQQDKVERARSRFVKESDLTLMIESRVEAKVGKIQTEVELLADYLAYDAAWHRRHDIIAGQNGWDSPLSSHLNLQEWMKNAGMWWPDIKRSAAREAVEETDREPYEE